MATVTYCEQYRNWLYADKNIRGRFREDVRCGVVWTIDGSHLPTFDEIAKRVAFHMANFGDSIPLENGPWLEIPDACYCIGIDDIGAAFIGSGSRNLTVYWNAPRLRYLFVDKHGRPLSYSESQLVSAVGSRALEWLKAQVEYRQIPHIIY